MKLTLKLHYIIITSFFPRRGKSENMGFFPPTFMLIKRVQHHKKSCFFKTPARRKDEDGIVMLPNYSLLLEKNEAPKLLKETTIRKKQDDHSLPSYSMSEMV